MAFGQLGYFLLGKRILPNSGIHGNQSWHCLDNSSLVDTNREHLQMEDPRALSSILGWLQLDWQNLLGSSGLEGMASTHRHLSFQFSWLRGYQLGMGTPNNQILLGSSSPQSIQHLYQQSWCRTHDQKDKFYNHLNFFHRCCH